ncbi:MAG TPA: helix-turn-helix transcriptional regulator [Acidimicrobiales bacterium]
MTATGGVEVIEASPTVWRRWLASELQRLRAEAGLEQKQVAKALRCTVTKVSYFENAQRPVVPRDLDEVLLPLYGVPEERWPEYLEAAHKARQKGWWESYGDDVLPEWLTRFVGLEQGASALRAYEPQYVTGLLQTAEYAGAVIRSGSTGFTEEQIEQRVQFRMRRQEVLDRGDEPLLLWVVLDEATLRRVVGGPAAMRAQLEHVVEVATDRPNVIVQVLPFERGAHAGMAGGFKILGFPWATDPGVVFLESGWSAGVYFEQPHEVEGLSLAFRKLCTLALPPEESIETIRAVAADLG